MTLNDVIDWIIMIVVAVSRIAFITIGVAAASYFGI